ncbi:MAG: CtsR family transcriptional regulator [Ruminococcaceae bacterium]|nr:CtsR family transcriptional regulator [Oscillospiraceae bacterium]
MRLSDMLTQYIMEMIEAEGNAEIKRNELADRFGCVPSQINYVLTSRFTPEQGYIIESRRGGGGYIRITRVVSDKATTLMHLINSIGAELDNITSEVMIKNLCARSIISSEAARLMLTAGADRTLQAVIPAQRDKVRASIYKNMLLALV